MLSGPKSTLNNFIERAKGNWDTIIEFWEEELIQNANDKYNNMVAEKEWTKTYPKDDKIIALTTRLY